MCESVLSELFYSLDILIMERTDEGLFRLLGTPPNCLKFFCSDILCKEKIVNPGHNSPFLENFLIDAEEFWASGKKGRLRSGPWLQNDRSGKEHALEAAAVSLQEKKLLLIELARSSYGEKQSLIQKGREVSLAYYRLAKTEAELKQAKEAAEKADRAKSEFLAHISHELRTPLNVVIGMSDILRTARLEAQERDQAEVIHSSAKMLLSLIGNVLDFSKIEAGKLELEILDFDIRQVTENVSAMFKNKAEEKGLVLRCHISEDIPRILRGDPDRLSQILLNLLSNAVKFTEKGEIEIRVQVTGNRGQVTGSREQNDPQSLTCNVQPVTCNVQPATCHLTFEISDTGIGIPHKLRDRLFKPFSQADNSVSRKYGGTGLGLVISKKLAELMRGEISVESEEGKGSTFRFSVCVERAIMSSQDRGKDIRIPGAAAHGCGKDIRILLAEDNELNRMVALAVLQKLGFRADIAENGAKAVEALKKTQYDIVLMDIQMPVMDGLEATKTVRDPSSGVLNSDIPIIALTAHAMSDDRDRCIAAGMNGYITKPIQPRKLLEVIEEVRGAGCMG